MPDFATSDVPAVQTQLDRLWRLSPGADVLGLDRIARLLALLGDPHRAMPPVFHVAGTNGKGSTCAFLRAALEAAGLRVHAYTSPHLVRFNERIRLAGRLIDDDALAALLTEVLDVAERGAVGASFFEVTTAAAFLAFARTPADACVIEVGLGGRLDATNVVRPLVCGIAQLGIDHEAFLGDTAEAIAGEKAGIAKPGVPLVTMRYAAPVAARVSEIAALARAPVLARGAAWDYEATSTLAYRDDLGTMDIPLPALPGAHQANNLGLAIAMLRAQNQLEIPAAALSAAATGARWPARMQRLAPGPLTELLPPEAELWLDGGHNAAAADAVAAALAAMPGTLPLYLVTGILANKDAATLLAALVPGAAGLIAVPVRGHDHHQPAELAGLARALGAGQAEIAMDVPAALRRIREIGMIAPPRVLVLGSLYLAGEVLRANEELPN